MGGNNLMLVTYSFAFDTETNRGIASGNVDANVALSILQRIIVASAVQKAVEEATPTEAVPKESTDGI